MANITKTIEIKAKGIRELRREWRDLRDEYNTATDPERQRELAIEIQRTRDHIEEVNREIKIMGSGSEFQRLKAELGGVSSALKSLDFDTALSRAQSLSKMSFQGVIGSLKTLGQTFSTLGRQLLTNPYFLLAAVVAAIIIALYDLQKEFGILSKYIELVSKPLNILIDGLKKLGDWIGLTNYKERELAEERLQRAQQERELAEQRLDRSDMEISAQQELLRSQGIHNRESLKQDLEYTRQIIQNSIDRRLALKEEAEANLAKLRSESGKEGIDEEIEKAEKALREAEKNVDESLIKLGVFMATSHKKLQEFDNKQAEEANKAGAKRIQQSEEEARKKLKIERELKQQEIDLMEEGTKKQLAILEFNFQKQVQDTSLRKDLSKEQKDKMIKNFTEIYDKERKLIESNKAQLEEDQEWYYETFTTSTQKAVDSLNETYKEGKDSLDRLLENEIISREDYNEKLLELERKHQDAIDELKGVEGDVSELQKLKNEKDEKIRIAKELADAEVLSEEELKERLLEIEEEFKRGKDLILFGEEEIDPLEKLREDKEKELEILKESLDNELVTYEEFVKAKEVIDAKYAESEEKIRQEGIKKDAQKWSNGLQTAQQFTQAFMGLSNALYDREMANAEDNEEAQERIREKRFKAEKAFNIVSAVLSTAQAIATTIGQLGIPAGIPASIVAGSLGAIQIATIASQKYVPGKTTAPRPKTPSSSNIPSTSSIPSTPDAPNVPDFGLGYNEIEDDSNIYNRPIIIENKVEVSETEITDKQRTVSNLTDYTNL